MRHLKITPCNQAVIFARVSSREQEQGASIDAQNDAITNYCAKQNFKIIKSFSITESSTKSSNKKVSRKKFYEMLNYVKGQKHKTAIVVHCIDRLQRTFNEYVELERLLKDDKIEMHFYKEGLVLHKNSSSSDITRWDMGILSAKMYVGSLKDNVVRSMDFNMSNGKWQSFAPIGYLNRKDCYNKSNVIIDPDRAPLVKKLFEEYATGMHSLNSISLLAKELKLSSVKTKSNKPITRNTVYHMLQSHFYYGYMWYDNNLIPHNYQPIIDKITYDKVQLILKGTDKPETKRGYGEVPFIFTGLVRCATCGCAMTPEKHKKKSGKEYTYLKCSHLKGNCNQKPVNENTILKQLEEEVFNNLSISENMASSIVDNIKTYFEDDKVAIAAIKRSITNDLNKLKEKENRLFDFYLEGNIDKTTYDKKKSEIDMEVAELEKTQEKYSNCNQDMTKTAQSVVDIALNAGKIFKSSKIHQKRQFLGLLLSNCKIKDKKLIFSITKPFDRLLKTTDFAEWLGY